MRLCPRSAPCQGTFKDTRPTPAPVNWATANPKHKRTVEAARHGKGFSLVPHHMPRPRDNVGLTWGTRSHHSWGVWRPHQDSGTNFHRGPTVHTRYQARGSAHMLLSAYNNPAR